MAGRPRIWSLFSRLCRAAAAGPAAPRHPGRFWGKIGAALIKAHQIEYQREVPETVFRRIQREIERSWLPRLLSWAKKSGQTEKQIWLPTYLPKATLLDEDTRARLFRTVGNRPAEGQAAEGLRKRPMTRAGHASPTLQKRPMTLRKWPMTRGEQSLGTLRKRPRTRGGGSSESAP